MSDTLMDAVEFPRKYPHDFLSQKGVEDNYLERVKGKVKLETEKDPFGKVPGVVLLVVGDSHVPRSEPKHEPTNSMFPYAVISRLDPRNLIMGKYVRDRQTRYTNAWIAETSELRGQMEASRNLLEKGFVPVVVHVGDVGADAELIGDMENAFCTVAEGMLSAEGAKVVMLPGDHEFDKKRHGGQVANKEMEMLGGKGWFYQRVGEKHMMLGVTTSLLGKIDEKSERLIEWQKRQNEMLAEAKEIADKEERKLILLGHKENELMKLAEEMDLPVEAVFSGHKHKGNLETEGEVVRGVVGAPTVGAFGLESSTDPSLIRLVVDGGRDLTSADVSQVKVDPNKMARLM